jgi:hypothetical protein
MVDMYVRLVKEGRRTIDQVPEQYRAEVQTIIEGGN